MVKEELVGLTALDTMEASRKRTRLSHLKVNPSDTSKANYRFRHHRPMAPQEAGGRGGAGELTFYSLESDTDASWCLSYSEH